MGDEVAPSDDEAATVFEGGDSAFEGGRRPPEAGADAGPEDATDGGGNESPDADGGPADAQAAPTDGASGCSALCAPALPAGWSGPYALFESATSPPVALPSCDAGAYGNHIDDGFEALDAGPPQCSCACGPVNDAGCGPPVVSFFSDMRCTQTCPPTTQTVAATCTRLSVDSCGPAVHFTVAAGAPSGSCEPDAATVLPSVPPENARICGLPSTATPLTTFGCEDGGLCVPALLDGELCVAQEGTWACPAGYPQQHMYYTAYSDSRSCTSCTCGPPTGIACTATLSTFGNPTCSGGFAPLSAPAQCGGVGVRSALTAGTTATGGACSPSGGQPTGGVTPTGARTVCCTK
jgi:hypothetical protein